MSSGWYQDPDEPSQHRFWDGTDWTNQVRPAPAPPSPEYAGVGVRIGANLLDFVVTFSIALPLQLLLPDSLFRWLVLPVVLGVNISTVATLGGSPGKLMLGLRVIDGSHRTPPGWGRAVARVSPALVQLLPGGDAWQLALAFACMFLVSYDDRNRSVFDRVAGTYVVPKDSQLVR